MITSNPCGFFYCSCNVAPAQVLVLHLKSLKKGVRNKFLTPFNSHLIRFPITAIIESEIFPNIKPQGGRINKKVNPFLNRRVRQNMRMSRSLAQGRGNMGCVLDKTKNIKCVLGGKRAKKKRMRIHPFYCILWKKKVSESRSALPPRLKLRSIRTLS